jgi:Ca2+/Na+ antiporter
MTSSIASAMLKLALFLFISSLVMLFIVAPYSAEFYVMLFTAILMVVLIAAAVIYIRFKAARESKDDEDGGV